MIKKGYINSTSRGGKRAQATTLQNKLEDNISLLYPYGFASNIGSDDSSETLLISSMGSSTNLFGIPYNEPHQPELESGEVAIGNFSLGENTITFKASGNVDLKSKDLNITSENVVITSTTLSQSGTADIAGDINTDGVYKVNDTQVVGPQGPAITDPTGGAVVDAEARTSLISLLTALRAHGLVQ